MYKRILVPLDGSHVSESVLPYARLFARTLKLPVELLRVVDPETLKEITGDYFREGLERRSLRSS